MTAKFNLETLDRLVGAMKQPEPRAIMIGPNGIIMLTAQKHVEPYITAGANWRRIKREWRKGFQKGREAVRSGDYDLRKFAKPRGMAVTARFG